MFESRSIASLSRSGIFVHTQTNSFHNMQKSNAEKKEKQIRYMKKRKETENGKTPGSEQPVVKGILWLTNTEAKSGIGVQRTSLDAQPSSLRELRTTKGPLCMNTASRLHRQRRARGKLMEPKLRSRLRNKRRRRWFFRTANALAKKTRPYSDFEGGVGGIWKQFITCIYVFI